MEHATTIVTVDAEIDTDTLDLMDESAIFDDGTTPSGDVSFTDTSRNDNISNSKVDNLTFEEVSDEELERMIRER